LTEAQARAQGFDPIARLVTFDQIERAALMGETTGLIKYVVERTGRVVTKTAVSSSPVHRKLVAFSPRRAHTSRPWPDSGRTRRRALEAANGDQAFALLQAHPEIALVVTDVVMPGLSGGALVDRLRTLNPALRVIYTSGYPDHTIVRHGALGPGVHSPKPIRSEVLLRMVREVLVRLHRSESGANRSIVHFNFTALPSWMRSGTADGLIVHHNPSGRRTPA